MFKPTSGPGLLIVCDAIQSWGAAVPGEDIELSELRSSWDPRVLFGNAISFMLGFTQRYDQRWSMSRVKRQRCNRSGSYTVYMSR